MSPSAKIVSEIFYTHALASILAVSVIHVMKRDYIAVSNDAILNHWPINLVDVMEKIINILFYFVVFEWKKPE
jgi:hypothetical protein